MIQRNVECGRTEKPAHTELTEEMRAAALCAARTRKPGGKIDEIVMTVALADYGAGGSMTEIAHRFGLNRNHLYERAQRAGLHKVLRVPRGAPALETTWAPPAPLEYAPGHRTRLWFPPETWALAKADYLAGAPASLIEAHYGIKEATLRDRAKREGWRRVDRKTLQPIRPAPDPAQVMETPEGEIVSKWNDIRHGAQIPPEGQNGKPWATWLFQGGRGAGKTRAGAEWLAARAQTTVRGRFALVGATLHDVREVMIDGPSGLRNLPGREIPIYEPSRRRLLWPSTQSEAYAFSADEPERLRGPQFEAAWADEFCTWRRGDYTLMLLRLGIRLGSAPQLVVTTTPKPSKFMRDLRAEASCVTTQAPTSANAAHLAETFLESVRALYVGTRWERQELDGVLLDGEGALFRHEDFAAARGVAPEAFARVVVAVDPAAGSEGAACGIVVAGRAGAHGYVLADATVHGATPMGWAHAVAAAARAWGADEIVAEANQGGDMVRAVLAMADPPCRVRLVHAGKSKHARAMPVAALYEQRRIVHVGAFARLEEELMSLTPDSDGVRLDRADAAVHALTRLMLTPDRPPPRLIHL